MPSPNVVAAILFLAYYELGMNNEAGESVANRGTAKACLQVRRF
jgi:hypothetical protein